MSARSVSIRLLAVVLVGIAAVTAVYLLESLGTIPNGLVPSVIDTLVLVFIGILFVNVLGGYAIRVLKPNVGSHAYTVRNVVQILGYIVIALAALSLLGVSPEVVLVGGTFSGLVLGLGAQLVLSNFFAGLVILTTGFIRVGDEVRLLTVQFPYQAAQWPAYKYFSPDSIDYGYRGSIVEVGLMYSAMVTDTGLGLKVPNQIVFSSAVVDYRSPQTRFRILQVRYEFEISLGPDRVLARAKDALAEVKEVEKVIFNEQSDKQYLIVLVRFKVPTEEDWSIVKSDILRRLAILHDSLKRVDGKKQVD